MHRIITILILFYLGCSKSTDPFIEISVITPIDMASPTDLVITETIKCAKRELKIKNTCIPCKTIIPDDFSTIIDAIKQGVSEICIKDGIYKEDLNIKDSLSIYGQGVNTIIQGSINIFQNAVKIELKNFKVMRIGSSGVLDLSGKVQQIILRDLIFTDELYCMSHSSNFGSFYLVYENNYCINSKTGLNIQRKNNSNSVSTVTIKNSNFKNDVNMNIGFMSDERDAGVACINIYNNILLYNSYSISQTLSLLRIDIASTLNTYIINNTFIPKNPKWITSIYNRSFGDRTYKTFLAYNLYEGILEESYPLSIQISNMLADDSYFADAPKDDYHLNKNSPAIDVYGGYFTGYDALKEDKDGTQRPLNSSNSIIPLYDVGAYEHSQN